MMTVIADVIVLRIQLRGVRRGPRTDADATEIEIETVIETDADATADAVVTVISTGSILSIRMFQRLLYDSLF